jgi:hypothetical protein
MEDKSGTLYCEGLNIANTIKIKLHWFPTTRYQSTLILTGPHDAGNAVCTPQWNTTLLQGPHYAARRVLTSIVSLCFRC